MMRPISHARDTAAGVRQIVRDGLIVARVRHRLQRLGHPIDELSDTELEAAMTEGLLDEMLQWRQPTRSTPPAVVSFDDFRERFEQAWRLEP